MALSAWPDRRSVYDAQDVPEDAGGGSSRGSLHLPILSIVAGAFLSVPFVGLLFRSANPLLMPVPLSQTPNNGNANPDAVPTCWIISPEEGSVVGPVISITLGFQAREVVPGHPTGVVQDLEIWVDDILAEARPLTPPQKEGEESFLIDVGSLPEGEHVLTGKAIQDGHEGFSAPVHVTVDKTLPQVPVLSLRYGCSDALTVEWVSPGDVVAGSTVPVTRQEIRYSDRPFYWEQGTVLSVVDALPPGEKDQLTLTNLPNSTWFYFSMRVWDIAGNWAESDQLTCQTQGTSLNLSGRVSTAVHLAEDQTYYVSEDLIVAPIQSLRVWAARGDVVQFHE